MTAPSSPTDERECSQPGSTSRLVMHRRVGGVLAGRGLAL
jgi:hypothetical protein